MWIVWNESEWVTFSDIRTLRFVNKNRLHCESCVFSLRADSIDGTPLHAALMKRIEAEQLGAKTPLQLKFIRESIAAEREYQERLAENADRDA